MSAADIPSIDAENWLTENYGKVLFQRPVSGVQDHKVCATDPCCHPHGSPASPLRGANAWRRAK